MATKRRPDRGPDEELIREARQLAGDTLPVTTKELRPISELARPLTDDVPPFDPVLMATGETLSKVEAKQPKESTATAGQVLLELPKKAAYSITYERRSSLHVYLPVSYESRLNRLVALLKGDDLSKGRNSMSLTFAFSLAVAWFLHLIEQGCAHQAGGEPVDDPEGTFAKLIQQRMASGEVGPGGLLEAVIDQLNEFVKEGTGKADST